MTSALSIKRYPSVMQLTTAAARRKNETKYALQRSALQHDQHLPLVLRHGRDLARRIRRLGCGRIARKHLRRLVRLRTARILARKQDALLTVLALVRCGNPPQHVLVDVQVVVGAQDVGFRQWPPAVRRRDAVEVVDAGFDAVFWCCGKSAGGGRGDGWEVAFESVDMVNVENRQALATE